MDGPSPNNFQVDANRVITKLQAHISSLVLENATLCAAVDTQAERINELESLVDSLAAKERDEGFSVAD